jgi:hypothetical protein
LRGLKPGDCLHSVPIHQRAEHVERPDSLQLADVDDAALPAQDGQIATK